MISSTEKTFVRQKLESVISNPMLTSSITRAPIGMGVVSLSVGLPSEILTMVSVLFRFGESGKIWVLSGKQRIFGESLIGIRKSLLSVKLPSEKRKPNTTRENRPAVDPIKRWKGCLKVLIVLSRVSDIIHFRVITFFAKNESQVGSIFRTSVEHPCRTLVSWNSLSSHNLTLWFKLEPTPLVHLSWFWWRSSKIAQRPSVK